MLPSRCRPRAAWCCMPPTWTSARSGWGGPRAGQVRDAARLLLRGRCCAFAYPRWEVCRVRMVRGRRACMREAVTARPPAPELQAPSPSGRLMSSSSCGSTLRCPSPPRRYGSPSATSCAPGSAASTGGKRKGEGEALVRTTSFAGLHTWGVLPPPGLPLSHQQLASTGSLQEHIQPLRRHAAQPSHHAV